MAAARRLDHRRRKVDADDAPERADALGERHAELAGAARDVDDRVARAELRALDGDAPPAAVGAQSS